MSRKFKPSPLALAVLALLYETPMHPYRMQTLIKERGKEQVINVERRASLYQTINQLLRADLIAVHSTARDENRPERTIYALTKKGLRTVIDWLRQIISTPAPEFPDFPAAISFLPLLAPQDAISQLEKREAALTGNLARIDSEFQQAAHLPRLFLLESELMRATLLAELEWVRGLIEDLRSAEITWSDAWLRGYVEPEGG